MVDGSRAALGRLRSPTRRSAREVAAGRPPSTARQSADSVAAEIRCAFAPLRASGGEPGVVTCLVAREPVRAEGHRDWVFWWCRFRIVHAGLRRRRRAWRGHSVQKGLLGGITVSRILLVKNLALIDIVGYESLIRRGDYAGRPPQRGVVVLATCLRCSTRRLDRNGVPLAFHRASGVGGRFDGRSTADPRLGLRVQQQSW